jgi:DNA-binding Lrp family transcriptional regulator
MSVKAYVLVDTVVGQEKEVKARIARLRGVQSVEIVTGTFDLIVVILGDDMTDIGKIVVERIRAVPGVQRTATCVVQPI